MPRSTRLIVTAVSILLLVGLLGYAIEGLDLVGMIASAHSPPPHGG